jgi:hypothetical protein
MNTPIARLCSEFERAHIDLRMAVRARSDSVWERSALRAARIALKAHPEYRPELERQSALNADRVFSSSVAPHSESKTPA